VSTTGGVGKGSFRLLVNPSAPSWQARGEDPHLDLRECLDCIYHETRHHEQFLRIVERYIWVTNRSDLDNNVRIGKQSGKSIPQVLEFTFKFPPGVAHYYAKRAEARYGGIELEEQSKWFEEKLGKYRDETIQVIDDARQYPKRRMTYYSLYRTLFMEEDGFQAGIAAGGLYLRQSQAAKKGKLQEAERILEARKAKVAGAPTKFRDWAVRAKKDGAADEAVRVKAKQLKAWVNQEQRAIKEAATKLNAARTLLGSKEEEEKKLIKGYMDEMTQLRIIAHEKRTKYGRVNYLGTATPGTKTS
jgi:hypothetical protein